jgi:GGDEF domain-containing protein
MSPNRPERGEDAGQTGAPDRPATPRKTPVTDVAQVQAQLDQLLAHCRRRRAGLALLRVSVERVSLPGASVSTSLEQRVRQEVANRIGNAVRGSDAILRESDRETCVVLPGADGAVAGRVGRRLERLVNGDYCVAGKLLQVTVGIGMAVHPEDGARTLELLNKAARRD